MRKLAILLVLLCVTGYSDPQVSRVVTFTTGTAVRVASTDTLVNSIFIQMLHGGTSLGYVLFADPAVTCLAATAGHLVAELSPATATGPGGSYAFPSNGAAQSQSGGTNARFWCAQGTTGDQAVISYNVRN